MKSAQVPSLSKFLVSEYGLTVLATTGPHHRFQDGPLAREPHTTLWRTIEGLWERLDSACDWGTIRNVWLTDSQGRSWVLHASPDPDDRVILAVGPVGEDQPAPGETVLRILRASDAGEAPRRSQAFSLGSMNRTYGPALIEAIRRGDLADFDRVAAQLVGWWRATNRRPSTERILGVHLAFLAYCEAAAVGAGVDPPLAEATADLGLRAFEQETAPADAVAALIPSLRRLAELVAQSLLQGKSGPVRTMVRFLAQNLHRSVTLQEAASAAGLSPNYAGTLLKQEGGEGFTDTLRRLRVERAKVLLRSTRDPVQDIANQVGFRQPDYFTKVFQAHVGCTPREYRRSVGETVVPSGVT